MTDKKILDKNNKTLWNVKREELHHFSKVDEMGFEEFIVCYVLKAERSNNSQYALGVYSKGESKQMQRHGRVHTIQTGERTWSMETSIKIDSGYDEYEQKKEVGVIAY